MAIIRAGSQDGTALVLRAGYPIKRRNRWNRWELHYLYWCHEDSAEGLVPADGSAPPGGIHATLDLEDVEIRPNDTPGMVDILLVYRQPQRSGSPTQHVANDVVKEAEMTWREMPVPSEEANRSGTNKEALEQQGYVSFGLAGVAYSYTQFLDAFTWSQVNLVDDMNDREAPTGLSGATATKWKKFGFTVREEGDLIVQTQTWQYSEHGWPDDFTQTTTTA